MRKIIANNIKNYLERKVKGSVAVRDDGKTIFIRIVYLRIEFKTKVSNLSTLILNGCTSNDIAYDILQEYKYFIYNTFFI